MGNGSEVEKFKAAFRQRGDYSTRLKPLRDRYAGLPKNARAAYGEHLDALLDTLQERYQEDDHDAVAPLLEQLDEALSHAEGLLERQGEFSRTLRRHRQRAREIPRALAGPVDSVLDELQKCHERYAYDDAAALFERLGKAIEDAEIRWHEERRKEVDCGFEAAHEGAPPDLQARLDELHEQAGALATTDLAAAAIRCEELIEYVAFLAREKARIVVAEREAEERRRLAQERERRLAIERNAAALATLVEDFDRYATLLEPLAPVFGKMLRGRHAKAVKFQRENQEIEDPNAVEDLRTALEEGLDFDFLNAVEWLEGTMARVEEVLDETSGDLPQVELRDLRGKLADHAEAGDFGQVLSVLEDVDPVLRALEGASAYEKLLEAARKEYERLEQDADAWLPGGVVSGYEDARAAAKEGRYSEGIKHLREVLAAVPKVDAVAIRWRNVKPAFEANQGSKATSAQKGAARKLAEGAESQTRAGELAKALERLDELRSYVETVEEITAWRTDEDRFPSVVGRASPNGGMRSLEDVKGKLADGGITADEVMGLIPRNVVERWRVNPGDPDRYKSGFKYEWTIGGVRYHVHGHSRDHKHGEGTNSGSGAVVRIQIDGRWLRSDGTTTANVKDDAAHIPLY